jgi:hypothetical protein
MPISPCPTAARLRCRSASSTTTRSAGCGRLPSSQSQRQIETSNGIHPIRAAPHLLLLLLLLLLFVNFFTY